MILQDSLDEWCRQEFAISTSFKEKVLLEYLWYYISLCYENVVVAENQDVSDDNNYDDIWYIYIYI